MNLLENIDVAIAAALKAGDEILAVYDSEFEVESKQDESPLTEADKRGHVAIVNELAVTDIPVLSEEGKSIPFSDRAGWDYFWMVDPLDGTKEFVKRNGEFTVNIALINKGKSIAGVVYVPVSKELYVGIKDHGSFKLKVENDTADWESLKTDGIALPEPIERPYTVVGSRSHKSAETEAFIESVQKERGEVEILSRGSSLKLCMVAEGRADAYPRYAPTMEWDTAAGHAVCTAAGFRVLQYQTEHEVVYNKENLLNPWFLVIK